ncbi:MAG: RagB/SusD family nutrient uptake outer membrane protein [Prevotella sp.]|nr:RagB/SusD family nutrient uptake outer membrane protein [Prevotella sp.]
MKIKVYIKNIIPVAAVALAMGGMTSCTGDLDVTPISPKLETQYDVNGLFEKCYAKFAMAGVGDGSINSAGDGNPDVTGYNDYGMTNLVRQMWNSNELTTDEAICTWGDTGIPEFNYNTYDDTEPMLRAYFASITSGISCCNQYLEVAADHDATMTAEVRYLRALEYYLLMDAFGNIPFSTTITKPSQISRAEAFEWIVNELLEIEPQLSAPKGKKSNETGYGRIDQAAAWMLLARLYLNAEVYTGEAKWDEAAKYAKQVMDLTTYKLNENGSANGQWSAYQMLFMGDNGETDAAYEAIFPILQNSQTTVGYGNSLFLIASCFNESMHANPNDPNGYNGTTAHWDGNRARPDLVAKFFPNNDAPQIPSYDMPAAAGDDRALFYGEGHTLDIDNVSEFTEGYGVAKFISYKSDGSSTYDPQFTDADWFFFRKAEAYLTYAEATARKNGGNATSEGIAALKALRDRAHAATKTSFTLDEILDEWSREFYFEGRRRVDLIRFGKYGGMNCDYKWQWKGGVKEGRNFEEYMNIFAIPATQLTSNGNLVQNPGYVK